MPGSASEQRAKMMLEEPISKVIPRLALPTIISMLISSVYNMADTYFVSQNRYLRLRGGGGDFLRHVADTGGGLHVRHGRGYQCEPGPGRPG